MQIKGFGWLENREFLETNGLGGYSYSTLIGMNTRRYHGLLVAGFSPEDRRVLLSKISERVNVGKKNFELSTTQYWDNVYPEGYSFQKSFSLDPFPTFVYGVGGLRVEKKICMPHGYNAVIVEYALSGGDAIFEADFLTTSRDHHWLLKKPDWNYVFSKGKNCLSLTPNHKNPPTLCIGSSVGEIAKPPDENLVSNLFYRKELERGYPCLEDLLLGGSLRLITKGPQKFYVVACADMDKKTAENDFKKLMKNPSGVIAAEAKRRNRLVEYFYSANNIKKSREVSRLVIAADGFVIKKDKSTLIIAGYPWFGEWGRDSLIAMPGLLLVTDRKKEAKALLANCVGEMKDSRVPNTFLEGSLGSIDASLWLFWSVWEYVNHTKDYEFVKAKIWPAMKDILGSYSQLADKDGLINNALPSQTWMDAIVDGKPVTPRTGKAVEIQALWFNALMVASKLGKKFNENGDYAERAARVKESFNKKFWNASENYLFDCIDGDLVEGAIRPNALFSISLPFPVLEGDRFKAAVSTAERELLTPYGLRTLSPRDSRYHGLGHGNPTERDLAYHQGDVWPWLVGCFADAYEKAYSGKGTKRLVEKLLKEHMWSAGVGCISEVFDGEAPHRSGGCVSQAWSVAEVLRVLSKKK